MRPAALRLSRVFVLLAALLVAATACGEATATRPCWKQVQDDWTDNQKIDNTYKAPCYDKAIKNLPRDLLIYSDAPDVIAAAKQRAVKDKLGRTLASAPNSSGGSNPGGGGGGGSEGPADVILNAGSSTTDGMPLPLLILGGVAILLLAAGAVGVTSRTVQARRTPPPE